MIKVALIEDEKQEQDKEKEFFDLFSKENNIKFSISSFENGDQFLFNFQYGKFDLILMDIELSSNDNGIQVSEKLRQIDKEVILVFMTNLAQYAIEGYKVNAYDYIVKPFTYFDFSQRMRLIVDNINSKRTEKVLIQTDGVKIVVAIKDIFYIEVANHQIIYHTSKGDFKTYGVLKDLEKDLKSFNFSLCNSCFLVNLEYVERIDGYNVIVNNTKLLISHPKRKNFLKELSLYLGQ